MDEAGAPMRTSSADGTDTDVPGAAARAPGRRLGKWHWPRWLPPPKVLLVIVIVVAFGFLLYRIRGDLTTALHRVRPEGLVWLPAAFGSEILSFLAYSGVQRRLLVAGGVRMPRRTVVRLTVAATGISNLVPGGTAPSSGWLVSQYRRHGVPIPLALWVVLAGGFAAGISVLFLLLLGAGIAGVLGAWPFAVLLVVLIGAAVAGVAISHHLVAVRTWLERDRRVPFLRLARRIVQHAGDVGHFRATIPGGIQVYALSIANWVLDVVVLAAGFAVLALPVPWRALLFAYAAAQVAGAIAPLPGGIGFVEGGMIGALTLAGTPAGDAVVATVIYRLITTLGLAGIGSLALVFVHRREARQAELTGPAAEIAARLHGAKGRTSATNTPAPESRAPESRAPESRRAIVGPERPTKGDTNGRTDAGKEGSSTGPTG